MANHILNHFRIYLTSKHSRQDLLSLRKILLDLRADRWNKNLPKRIQLLKWINFGCSMLLILIEIGGSLWKNWQGLLLRECLSDYLTSLLNNLRSIMFPSDSQNFFVWFFFYNLTGGDSSLAIDPLSLNFMRVLIFHDML